MKEDKQLQNIKTEEYNKILLEVFISNNTYNNNSGLIYKFIN